MSRFAVPAVLLLVICSGTFIQAEAEEDYTVSLVTSGPGSEVYLWWGHIALLVEDHSLDRDYLYDFGVFSFETENFLSNFILGRLWYMSYRSSGEAGIRRTIPPNPHSGSPLPPGKQAQAHTGTGTAGIT